MPRSRGYYWIKVEKITPDIPKEIDTSGRIVECDPTKEQFGCCWWPLRVMDLNPTLGNKASFSWQSSHHLHLAMS